MIIDDYLLIRPNWQEGVGYRRKWQTTILSSIDGSEQRSALLTWPRRSLSYSLLTNSFMQSSSVLRRIYKRLRSVWGIPFWQDRTTLTSQALSGQKILNVRSTENRNFEVGGPCILLDLMDEEDYESGIMDSKTATSLTLRSNLSNTWKSGTEVFPVLQGRMKSGQTWTPIATRMGKIEIDVNEEFDPDLTRTIGISSYDTYYGYPLFDRGPNTGKDREIRFLHPFDTLGWIGKTLVLDEYKETLLRLSMTHLAYERTEVQKILDFFDSQKGRWGGFWIPTWLEDIRITSAFGPWDTSLEIEDISFSDYFEHKEMGTYITILWPDGTRICTRVLDAPTPTTLTLDGAIGKSCEEADLGRLLTSFLLFCRFDMDEIEMRLLTDYIAECNLTFQNLYGEAPGGIS